MQLPSGRTLRARGAYPLPEKVRSTLVRSRCGSGVLWSARHAGGIKMTTLVTAAAVRAKDVPIAPTRDQSDDSTWRTLYRVGGLAALAVVAIATYFASTTAFEMLSASGQYAAASGDTERTIALAAGQVLLLTWQGTAFSVSYLLAGLAQLLVAIAMLRRGPFGTITAYAGILAGVLTLVPPTVGAVGLVFSLVSLLPMWAFLILAGRRLLLLSSDGRSAT